jgi:DNA-binding response OmpR family regulator
VEDERDIASLIKDTLERTGDMEVESVTSGEAAVKATLERTPDLIILDVNLPALNGFEVCRILRSRPNTAETPIMMLTARTSENDRVVGLDLGADDYITKPFSLRELAARVRAMMRRGRRRLSAEAAAPRGTAHEGRHLRVDFDAVSVSVDGKPVRLTRREFQLLRYLIGNANRVLTRDQLLERVWGYQQPAESRSVDVHVARLRAKLGVAGAQIETLVGLGYRFIDS